jgi:hypothetical protein
MFWSALRRWGERAVAAGFLTIDAVKNRDPTVCTLPGTTISPPSVAEEPPEPALAIGQQQATSWPRVSPQTTRDNMRIDSAAAARRSASNPIDGAQEKPYRRDEEAKELKASWSRYQHRQVAP